ncbi:MAG: HD domain-containing protein [Burkholderiales bacterium]|nr:HD domain-containing protein [Burkholderiales bacterium]
MAESEFVKVNAHFVDHLVELSNNNPVIATEDIYSGTGVKLLMKGTPVTQHLRDRLLAHKLVKPLEASLQVTDAVDGDELSQLVRTIAEERPELDALCGLGAGLSGSEGRSERRWWSLAYVRSVPLDSVSLLLLTMGRRDGGIPLRHAVMVTLIALGLGRRMRVSEETLRSLTIAGLLHDVGELYIDPQTLAPGHRVTIKEWRDIVAHPAIGYKLLRGIGDIGPSAARAVLEHHERWDGSGYPRGITGAQMSIAGQVVAAAEMLTGLLNKSGQTLQRVHIALKALSPGLAPDVLAAIHDVMAEMGTDPSCAVPNTGAVIDSLRSTADVLAHVEQVLGKATAEAQSIVARELIADVNNRFQNIHRAFSRSGPGSLPIEAMTALLSEADAGDLVNETADVCDEIRWRLRELARSTVTRVAQLEEAYQVEFTTLLTEMQVAG